MAQLVKNLPAMKENWLRSLGWEDLLEKEMATHSSILAWRISWTEEPGGLYSPRGSKESDMTESSLNGETDIENILIDMGRGEERVRFTERVTWRLTLPYVT